MAERLFTKEQIASLLGSTPSAVEEWMRRGWLEYQRLPGGPVRVPERGLIRFLKGQGIDIQEILDQVLTEETTQTRRQQAVMAYSGAPGGGADDSDDVARQLLLAAQESVTDAMVDADFPRSPQPMEESFDEETFVGIGSQNYQGERPSAPVVPGPIPMPPPDNAPVDAQERTALVPPIEVEERSALVAPADEGEELAAVEPIEPVADEEPAPSPEADVHEELAPAPEPALAEAEPVADDLPAQARALLAAAATHAAESLHLEAAPTGLALRLRIAGQIVEADQLRDPALPATAPAALAETILALPRNAAGMIELLLPDRPCRFRVVACPSRYGQSLVIYPQTADGGLDRLGLTPVDAETLAALLTEAYGFILVAGMSGTETAGTLRAMLSVAAGPQHSVALIERSLRLELGSIAHCLVGEDSPAPAVQAYSLADADVVVLDAIANAATARAVCLTGRDLLVLAGIGARGASEALSRLIELQVAPWAMADSMLAVVQQHNARRLCDSCKQSVAPDTALLQRLGLTGEEIAGGVYQPGSCDQCGHTGHVGRISVRSLVPLTGEPADLVRHEAGSREVTRCVEALARAALCRAGLAHVVAGHISLAELVRVVGE